VDRGLEDRLRREYPARMGWELIEIGNRVIAHNRWGGAREVAHRFDLGQGSVRLPRSWRLKDRYRN